MRRPKTAGDYAKFRPSWTPLSRQNKDIESTFRDRDIQRSRYSLRPMGGGGRRDFLTHDHHIWPYHYIENKQNLNQNQLKPTADQSINNCQKHPTRLPKTRRMAPLTPSNPFQDPRTGRNQPGQLGRNGQKSPQMSHNEP
jgi:hypothetical protein